MPQYVDYTQTVEISNEVVFTFSVKVKCDNIGTRLRKSRKRFCRETGQTFYALCQDHGLTRQNIGQIENKKIATIPGQKLDQIEKMLKTDFGYRSLIPKDKFLEKAKRFIREVTT